MSLDPEQLAAAIKRNDAVAVRELLRDATEADRRACAKALRRLLADPKFNQVAGIPFGGPDGTELIDDRHRTEDATAAWIRRQWDAADDNAAFMAASLGLAGGVAAAHIAADRFVPWRQPAGSDLDAIAGVLADRRPPWLAELVRRKLCDQFDLGLDSWTLALRLVRLGAIDRPGVPQYTTKIPSALHRYVWDREGRSRFIQPLDGLLADPGLLDDEIWRLFTVPGAATWLGAWDDGLWEDALATLAEQGRLDRGRLLDACLDAFTRDFPPNQVGWYVTFHDRMNPSLDEMAIRAGRYLALLAAGSKPGVSLGQQACGRLLDAGRLPAEDFLAASGPTLLFPQKNVATAQLKLIGKIAAAPLDDPAELIQLLTQLMEDASDTLAVERAMAGAVRLCVLPAAERARLAAPLLKRAEKRVREDYDGPLGGRLIASDIAGLTLVWGSGWSPDIAGARRASGSVDRETVLRSGQAKTMAGILTARIWEACALAAGGHPVQLLAEPESGSPRAGPDHRSTRRCRRIALLGAAHRAVQAAA